MTANIITAIGVALIVGSAIFGGGGSNGAAEHPAFVSVPPARLFPLGSVTRPTATPYSAVSSIEDGRESARLHQELPQRALATAHVLGSHIAPVAPALPLSIEARICAMPWPCQQALAVAWCESRMDPAATNGAHIGLFQLSPRWHGWRLGEGESFFDAAASTRIASEIWSESRWIPWRSSRACHGL
jgi:hypothetical protein